MSKTLPTWFYGWRSLIIELIIFFAFSSSVKREFQCQGKTLEVKKAEEKARDDGMGGGGRGGMYR